MAQFKAFEASVEVNGESVLSVVNGMGNFKSKAAKILEDNGIPNPQPGNWYLQQNWLNAFKTISTSLGPATLHQIGQSIPESANFPPEINNIHKALASIDVAYHMNHRNGEIGHYQYSKTGETSAKVICDNPYPTEFDKGIIEAMVKKFKPKDILFVKVVLDDTQPTRNKDGNSDTFLVSW